MNYAQPGIFNGFADFRQGAQFQKIRASAGRPGDQEHHSAQEEAAPDCAKAAFRREGQHLLHPPHLCPAGGGQGLGPGGAALPHRRQYRVRGHPQRVREPSHHRH